MAMPRLVVETLKNSFSLIRMSLADLIRANTDFVFIGRLLAGWAYRHEPTFDEVFALRVVKQIVLLIYDEDL